VRLGRAHRFAPIRGDGMTTWSRTCGGVRSLDAGGSKCQAQVCWQASTRSSEPDGQPERTACGSRRPGRMSSKETVMSVYRVTEIIGTSGTSWEDAAAEAIRTAALERRPGRPQPDRTRPRPDRETHGQGGHRHRRPALPPRRPGDPGHPPDPPHHRQQMAHRNLLRHYLTTRRAGPASPARGMDPRPLENREPAALGPRRHLRRGPLPGTHRHRAPRHGRDQEPGHLHPAPGRPRQHRPRPAAHRAEPRTRTPPAHGHR